MTLPAIKMHSSEQRAAPSTIYDNTVLELDTVMPCDELDRLLTVAAASKPKTSLGNYAIEPCRTWPDNGEPKVSHALADQWAKADERRKRSMAEGAYQAFWADASCGYRRGCVRRASMRV